LEGLQSTGPTLLRSRRLKKDTTRKASSRDWVGTGLSLRSAPRATWHKPDFLLRGQYGHLLGQDADARSDDGTFYATSVDQNFPCCATDSGAYDSALKGCAADACGEAKCRGSH